MRDPIAVAGANVLAALGDPTRRLILDLLTEHGPASASELASHVEISRQALSKHLSTLVSAGALTTSRVGREVRYAISAAALDAAAEWLDARARQWDAQLATLKQAAEGERRAPAPFEQRTASVGLGVDATAVADALELLDQSDADDAS